MEREQTSYHMFYGTAPLLAYLGISAALVYVGRSLHWDSGTLNFINAAVNLLVLYFGFYRPYKHRVPECVALHACDRQGQRTQAAMPIWTYLWIPITGVCCSLAANNWFQLLHLNETIDSYEKVAQNIYSGGMAAVVIRTVVLAPVMEELLMRGLLYGALSRMIGKAGGTLLSAVVFGAVHGNLLQGIYAFILGVVFAVIYEMYDRNLFSCILAHLCANLVSVAGTLIPQTAEFLVGHFYLVTFASTVLLSVCMLGIGLCHKRYRKSAVLGEV